MTNINVNMFQKKNNKLLYRLKNNPISLYSSKRLEIIKNDLIKTLAPFAGIVNRYIQTEVIDKFNNFVDEFTREVNYIKNLELFNYFITYDLKGAYYYLHEEYPNGFKDYNWEIIINTWEDSPISTRLIYRLVLRLRYTHKVFTAALDYYEHQAMLLLFTSKTLYSFKRNTVFYFLITKKALKLAFNELKNKKMLNERYKFVILTALSVYLIINLIVFLVLKIPVEGIVKITILIYIFCFLYTFTLSNIKNIVITKFKHFYKTSSNVYIK